MKFAVIRLACIFEPPIDTLPRYRGSVANRAWHPPFAPDVFAMRSHLRWWLDSGKDALVDRRSLYKIAHHDFLRFFEAKIDQ
jgi:hypothetical protein